MQAMERTGSRSRAEREPQAASPWLIAVCLLIMALSLLIYFGPTLRARFLSNSDGGDVSVVASWCVSADMENKSSIGTIQKGKTQATFGCTVQSRSETAVAYRLTIEGLPNGITAELFLGNDTPDAEALLDTLTVTDGETLSFPEDSFAPCAEGASCSQTYTVRFSAGAETVPGTYDDIIFGVQFYQIDEG